MSILIDKKTRLVVQGITGKEGSFHTGKMIEYGTKVVAGVTPSKGGQKDKHSVPIFDTVLDAVQNEGANTSVIFVPPPFAADAILESISSGIKVCICITEGIPVNDMARIWNSIALSDAVLIGPNCPGVISPGKAKVGIMPGFIHRPGNVGVISRSGTLTYEAVGQLTKEGLGQSTCIGIGGDPIIGMKHKEALEMLYADDETEAILLIGEIGGTDEEDAMTWLQKNKSKLPKKPIAGFIAGQTAPPGKRMGHAGAIIAGDQGTAESKMKAMRKAGVKVIKSPAKLGVTIKSLLK